MLLLIGLACTPEVELRQQVGISGTEFDFGEVPIGTWQENAFLIENTGEAPVQILSSDIIGASEGIWSLAQDGPEQLEVGDYITYSLRFTPSQMRQEDVRVQIRLDIEDLSTLYINGTGVGGLSINDLDGDGFSPAQGDCNDNDSLVFPGAEEICDGKDSDCDGGIPDAEEDIDADGFLACIDDCDDLNNSVYPGAPELCDDLDNDCDGIIPDDQDIDGDGQTACQGDCNDLNSEVWYGNQEECNFLDSDCNGLVDDIDNDGDGHSMCPSGGDCDDSDPFAYPVVFDSTPDLDYEEGDGTPSYPYKDFNSALENVDELCRTIMIAPGAHEVASAILSMYVEIKGAGQYPDDTVLIQSSGRPLRILMVKFSALVNMSNLTMFGVNTGYEGGGVMVKSNGIFQGEDLYFVDNYTIRSGGAVGVINGNFSCTRCEFINNAADNDGGAIYSTFWGNVEVTDSLFSNNLALQGAAVSLTDSNLLSQDNLYIENEVSGEGGAIAVYEESVLTSTRDRFWSNQSDESGGALVFRNIQASPSVISNAQFQDNLSWTYGGAVSSLGDLGGFVLTNSTFVANFAAEEGGDLYLWPDFSPDGFWVWSNISTLAYGAEAMFVGDGVQSSFAFNSCYSPSTGVCYQTPEESDAGFNDNLDPQFVSFSDDNDPTNDDLSLQSTSPMLNSGPFDGQGPNENLIWLNADGTRNHRGHNGGPNAD